MKNGESVDKFDKFGDEDNNFSENENKLQDESEDEKQKLPHTVKLKRPIEIGGKKYTELVFKYPVTIAMMKALPVSEEHQKLGHFLPMISGMTGEPSSVVEMLSVDDFNVCVELARSFF